MSVSDVSIQSSILGIVVAISRRIISKYQRNVILDLHQLSVRHFKAIVKLTPWIHVHIPMTVFSSILIQHIYFVYIYEIMFFKQLKSETDKLMISLLLSVKMLYTDQYYIFG